MSCLPTEIFGTPAGGPASVTNGDTLTVTRMMKQFMSQLGDCQSVLCGVSNEHKNKEDTGLPLVGCDVRVVSNTGTHHRPTKMMGDVREWQCKCGWKFGCSRYSLVPSHQAEAQAEAHRLRNGGQNLGVIKTRA